MRSRRSILAVALAACTHGGALERVRFPDMHARLAGPDWARMTSPIEAPMSLDGRQRVDVWLRVPSGVRLDARRERDRWVLVYPSGACAERVEWRDGRAVDVRGTVFDEAGEVFHTLRRGEQDGLAGFAWRRGDRAARDEAIRTLARRVASRDPNADVHFYCRTGDCAGCHVHDKPAHAEASLPPLPTDDGGLYRVMTVLEDAAPLVESRDRDPNLESRFVTVSCASGAPAIAGATARCPGGEAPTGRFDMRAALRAGDPHARAVCASRAFLRDRMTPRARDAFADAFEECRHGLTSTAPNMIVGWARQ